MLVKPPSFVYLKKMMEGKLPEKVEIQFTDRYQALGISYPDPKTVCKGHCEGTGFIPIYLSKGDKRENRSCITDDNKNPEFIERWEECEKKEPTDDGWHFIKCPKCEGTGLRKSESLGLDNFDSDYGIIADEEQKCPDVTNDYVVDLRQKPVSNRKVTRVRDVKAVGIEGDRIPGAEIWDDDEEEGCGCHGDSEEVVDTLLNTIRGN